MTNDKMPFDGGVRKCQSTERAKHDILQAASAETKRNVTQEHAKARAVSKC